MIPAQFFGLTSQGLGIFLIEEEENLFFLDTGQNLPKMNYVIKEIPLTGKSFVITSNGKRGDILN